MRGYLPKSIGKLGESSKPIQAKTQLNANLAMNMMNLQRTIGNRATMNYIMRSTKGTGDLLKALNQSSLEEDNEEFYDSEEDYESEGQEGQDHEDLHDSSSEEEMEPNEAYYDRIMLNGTGWMEKDDALLELLNDISKHYSIHFYIYKVKFDILKEDTSETRARTYPPAEQFGEILMEFNVDAIRRDLMTYEGFADVVATLRHEYVHVQNNIFAEQESAEEAIDEVEAYTEAILDHITEGDSPAISKKSALNNYRKAWFFSLLLDGSTHEAKAREFLEAAEQKLKEDWDVTDEQIEKITRG